MFSLLFMWLTESYMKIPHELGKVYPYEFLNARLKKKPSDLVQAVE